MSGDDFEMHEARQKVLDREDARIRETFAKQIADQGLLWGLPSGKSLEEKTEELLGGAHVKVRRSHSRSIVARVMGCPGFDRALYAKPSQIPDLVSDGRVALGLTGMDCVQMLSDKCEYLSSRRNRVHVCAELPYSRNTEGATHAVLFTTVGNPVNSVAELPVDVRIVSEYPDATRKLLSQHRKNAEIVACTGAAESLVLAGVGDYGVTLTETGDTLRVNGLKIIARIFKSNTVLIANKLLLDEPKAKEWLAFLERKLLGVIQARYKVYLLMNAPHDRVLAISGFLKEQGATLKEPTVSSLFNTAFCSIGTVVNTNQLNAIEIRLAQLGASGFVELDPLSVM